VTTFLLSDGWNLIEERDAKLYQLMEELRNAAQCEK
jgi:hypothetical protein